MLSALSHPFLPVFIPFLAAFSKVPTPQMLLEQLRELLIRDYKCAEPPAVDLSSQQQQTPPSPQQQHRKQRKQSQDNSGAEAYSGEIPALGDGGAGMGYEGEWRLLEPGGVAMAAGHRIT